MLASLSFFFRREYLQMVAQNLGQHLDHHHPSNLGTLVKILCQTYISRSTNNVSGSRLWCTGVNIGRLQLLSKRGEYPRVVDLDVGNREDPIDLAIVIWFDLLSRRVDLLFRIRLEHKYRVGMLYILNWHYGRACYFRGLEVLCRATFHQSVTWVGYAVWTINTKWWQQLIFYVKIQSIHVLTW